MVFYVCYDEIQRGGKEIYMKYAENAKRLKEAMEKEKITQKELSARTGIRKSSLSQYMNGDHWPDNNLKVGQIANALGVNPAWLMGFDVPMQTESPSSDENPQQGRYYIDDETTRFAEDMATNPDLRALYDVQRDMDTDDLKALYGMALALKRRAERLDSDDPA